MIQQNKIMQMMDTVPPLKISNRGHGYTYNDTRVPSVTQIISKCIHSEGLLRWANHLGFMRKDYTKERNNAAAIGTSCHNLIDYFSKNGVDGDLSVRPESINAYESFKAWYNQISANNTVRILCHEMPLVCKYFGGTLDALYEINGKLYIVDYKTSNDVSDRYFLQLAAYIYMLREEYGIYVAGCIILQLSKKSVSFTEYLVVSSNPAHLQFMCACEQAFLSLLYSYYNIGNIERQFKDTVKASGE